MNLEAARALAYAELSRREQTTHEVREHLLARGADEQVATRVVLDLTEQGYLDDRRFARLFTQDKRDLSGWGTSRIRRALIDRGIAAEMVESALLDAVAAGTEHATTQASELERALAVLRRRFPNPPATSRDRDRALGVLIRKGYDYELAADALAEHVRQVGDAVAPPCPQY